MKGSKGEKRVRNTKEGRREIYTIEKKERERERQQSTSTTSSCEQKV